MIRQLLKRGAEHTGNANGNTPLHWAVQTKAKSAVELLTKHFKNIDVLQRNEFGKGSVSEGFNAEQPEIVQLLLEHKSANALMPKDGKKQSGQQAAQSGSGDESPLVQQVDQRLQFSQDGPEIVIRETGTDNFGGLVFTGDASQDTTGTHIWAAGLVFSRWIVAVSAQFEGKTVLELGAGCGLPGIVALCHTTAKNVRDPGWLGQGTDVLADGEGAHPFVR